MRSCWARWLDACQPVSMLRSSYIDVNGRTASSCCCQWDCPMRDAAYGCCTVTVTNLGKEERVGFRNVWQLKDLVWMPSSSWDNCVTAFYSQRRKDFKKKRQLGSCWLFLRKHNDNVSWQNHYFWVQEITSKYFSYPGKSKRLNLQ